MKKLTLILSTFLLLRSLPACESCGCALHKPIVFDQAESNTAPPVACSCTTRDAKDLKNLVASHPAESPLLVFAGVQTQYTYFGTLQQDGNKVANEVGQYLHSINTQIYAGCQINDRLSVQVNVPWIVRDYKRPEGFAIDRGTLSGVGDVILALNTVPVRLSGRDWNLDWTLGGGVQFPTGDSSRIAEELNEVEVPGAPVSGIHGHDLALGAGATNGFFSTGLHFERGRWFFSGDVHYFLRTTGSYGYRYANELGWSGGPGATLWQNHQFAAALQFQVNGDAKGLDTFQGEKADDTQLTAVYLGPKLSLDWTHHLSVEAAVEIPVVLESSSLQAVPDYRLQTGIVWHF